MILTQVIINNRRLQYEERASASPLDYDNWFDYLRLEESAGDLDRAREVRLLFLYRICAVAGFGFV